MRQVGGSEVAVGTRRRRVGVVILKDCRRLESMFERVANCYARIKFSGNALIGSAIKQPTAGCEAAHR